MNTMGQRIRERRESLLMSQAWLGFELGVTAQAVMQWEHDETRPDLDRAPALAKVLGVSTDWLICAALRPERKVTDAEIEAILTDARDDLYSIEATLRVAHDETGLAAFKCIADCIHDLIGDEVTPAIMEWNDEPVQGAAA